MMRHREDDVDIRDRWAYSVGSFAASSSTLANDDFNNAN